MALIDMHLGGAEVRGGRFGEVIQGSSQGHRVARIRNRPRKQEAHQRYAAPWQTSGVIADWQALSAAERQAWMDWAAQETTWPLNGGPQRTNGFNAFSNFYTVLLLLDPAAIPPTPPTGYPVWTTRKLFFEFAEWSTSTLYLKVQNAIPVDTKLLFLGSPPSATVLNSRSSREKIIGIHEFTSAVAIDTQWTNIDGMFAAEYGATDTSLKYWGRIIELIDGFASYSMDFCTADPSDEPPPSTVSFEFEVYNAYTENCDLLELDILDSSGTLIGFNYDATPDAGQTETGTVELDEGKTLDDVDSTSWTADFSDFTMGMGGDSSPGLEPYEFTIDSMM